MPVFRLIFFRSNRLDHWETIEAASTIEAVQQAAEWQSDEVVELWGDEGRVATFRPAQTLGSHPPPRRRKRRRNPA